MTLWPKSKGYYDYNSDDGLTVRLERQAKSPYAISSGSLSSECKFRGG